MEPGKTISSVEFCSKYPLLTPGSQRYNIIRAYHLVPVYSQFLRNSFTLISFSVRMLLFVRSRLKRNVFLFITPFTSFFDKVECAGESKVMQRIIRVLQLKFENALLSLENRVDLATFPQCNVLVFSIVCEVKGDRS